jgi:hypothetical protein
VKPKRNCLSFEIILSRVLALGLAVALFYGATWLPLQVALRDGVGWFMRWVRLPAIAAMYKGSPALRVGDKQFHFTPECTYVDLWLFLIPFLWRLDWTWRRNVVYVLSFGLLVGTVNFIRVCMSTYLYTTGHTWLVSHSLEDYALFYPTLLWVVVTAMRRDWTLRSAGTGSHSSI